MADPRVQPNHPEGINLSAAAFIAAAFIYVYMYFCKLPYIIYRDYPKFGYLTDNRNYGYDTNSRSRIKVGDRILSKSGSVFYSILTDEPQSISEISRKLQLIYSKVPLEEIQKDAVNFFMELSKDGFIEYSESNKKLSNSYFFFI